MRILGYCQRYKQQDRGYRMLPPQYALIAPWNKVCVDLTVHWVIAIQNNVYV